MSKVKNRRRSKRKRHAEIVEHEVGVGEDDVRSHYEPSIAGEINEMDHDIEVDDVRADDEDDEDIIDVDEEDGEPRLSKRGGALKHEAKDQGTPLDPSLQESIL